MRILERPNAMRAGFASLANIGYDLYEVSLDGEVYKRATSRKSMRYKAERVGSNRWKIYTRDRSGRLIERVMRQDVFVGCAWYNIDESLWENSTYADAIRRCKEFFSISDLDKAKTIYKTSNGFYYYVTRFGDVWSTEKMVKLKGRVNSKGYRHVILGSVHDVTIHRLVAQHFVSVPKDLVDQTLVVNHIDGDKLNNRWDNLEWTTNKGNLEHASINGLMYTTIDDHLLECVWQYLLAGYSDINISKETGISASTVYAIRHGLSRRYRTDKYTWSKRRIPRNKLDKATVFSIYDDFTYTDKKNCELSRKYNVSNKYISKLRTGYRHSNLAHEYITSKGLDGYWKGYRPSK